MSINNMNDLIRECANTIEDLRSRKIEVEEACAMSELAKTTIAAVKAQLAFAHMTKQTPKIDFIGDCVEISPVKALLK